MKMYQNSIKMFGYLSHNIHHIFTLWVVFVTIFMYNL